MNLVGKAVERLARVGSVGSGRHALPGDDLIGTLDNVLERLINEALGKVGSSYSINSYTQHNCSSDSQAPSSLGPRKLADWSVPSSFRACQPCRFADLSPGVRNRPGRLKTQTRIVLKN